MPTTKKKEIKEKIQKVKTEKIVEKKEVKSKKTVYTSVGRRKTAVARARIVNEKGELLVNGKPIEKYFPGEKSKNIYSEPMRTTNLLGRISGTFIIEGGGINSQLEALVLSLSRALMDLNPSFKAILRKKGFLTRDPRAKERGKPGLMGARKKKQSPKR